MHNIYPISMNNDMLIETVGDKHMDMNLDYNVLIPYALENFGLAMLILAIAISIIEWLFHKLFRTGTSGATVFYRWIALLAVGATCIYAFIMHAFFSEMAAKTIGWATTPFQYEVAVADLAIGVLAILSFGASLGFRVATVIGTTIWFWGDAVVHVYEMMTKDNFAVGNAGSWLWIDIAVPILLIICLLKICSHLASSE